jgi:hypothetical protein
MLTENTDNFITGSLFRLDGGQTKSVWFIIFVNYKN